MKFLKYMRDGGPESKVTGFWLVEIKSLFSIVLLKFANGSRDAYHSHAFNAVSWLLSGMLLEHSWGTAGYKSYLAGLIPIFTPRNMCHQVQSSGTSWVLSFRGPWAKTWHEYISSTGEKITLTHGRKVVNT